MNKDIGKKEVVNKKNIFTLYQQKTEYQIYLPNHNTDYIQSRIANDSEPYEVKMLEDIAARVSGGSVFVDVGANVGNHSLYLAAVSGCRVIAYEPNEALADAIRVSSRLNNLDDSITVFSVGVGSASGKAKFSNLNAENLGAQSLSVNNIDDEEGQLIEVVSLDQHLNVDAPISVIKIDVEGMELDVLDGADALINKFSPIVYIECITENVFIPIYDWLTERGYIYWDTFNATPTHLFVPSNRAFESQLRAQILFKSVRKLYRLNADNSVLRERLDVSAKKYRAVTQRVSELDKEISFEKLTSKDLASQLEHVNQKLFDQQLQLKTEEISNKENQHKFQLEQSLVLKLRKELEDAYDKIKESELKVERYSVNQLRNESQLSKYSEEVDRLLLKLNSLNEKYFHVKSSLEEKSRSYEKNYKLFISRQGQVDYLIGELDRERKNIERLNLMLEDKTLAYEKNEGLLAHLKSEFESEKRMNDEVVSNMKMDFEKEISDLSEKSLYRELELSNLQNKVLRLEVDSDEQKKIIKVQQRSLDEANKKYRELTGVQIVRLKDRIVELETQIKALGERSNKYYELHLKSENKRMNLERRILELRASTVFKIGSLVQENYKSILGPIKIGVGIWRLYSRVRKRRRLNVEKIKRKEASKKVFTSNNSELTTIEPVHEVANKKLSEKIVIDASVPRKAMKIATIMDGFTFSSYSPECELYQLTPDKWKEELTEFKPELLFVESAWRGKDDAWGNKISHNSHEIRSIVSWCKSKSIPTIFWNKEDPVHFETFLNTAKLFDCVFTTDIDCIHRYKTNLKHDRVYFLPFACQPAFHNPVEFYKRKDRFCFAGAYYARYPSRVKDLNSFIGTFSKYKKIDIYDRNYGKTDVEYMFPENFRSFIVGTLPFQDIDKAYKGYRYGISLNSVKNSQSMFARRVFELLACNTVTLSNFSQGIKLFFGDLVVSSDDGEEILRKIQSISSSQENEDKFKLKGLRQVMMYHTYERRLDYVLSKTGKDKTSSYLPSFNVFSLVAEFSELVCVIENVKRQVGVDVSLFVIILDDSKLSVTDALHNIELQGLDGFIYRISDIKNKTISEFGREGCWSAAFSNLDYYGENYLLDIALASKYCQAQIIGKKNTFSYELNKFSCLNELSSYCSVVNIPVRSSAVSEEVAASLNAFSWVRGIDGSSYEEFSQFSIDRFNYCRSAGGRENLQVHNDSIKSLVDDLDLIEGVSFDEMVSISESIKPGKETGVSSSGFSASKLYEMLGSKGSKKVKIYQSEAGIKIESKLDDEKHEYLYSLVDISRSDLSEFLNEEEQLQLYMDADPGLNLSVVILFLDDHSQRVGHRILKANSNFSIDLPVDAQKFRFGLRVYSSGESTLRSIDFSHRDIQPPHVFTQSDVLVLTNHYASYDDLYRNAFVHRRIKTYQDLDRKVDVFRYRKDENIGWHEFQGVNVITGSQESLRTVLSQGQYRKVLVHFIDASMWDVLKGFMDELKVVIWVHGAEIQPWSRRAFNYLDSEALAIAKLESDKRMLFWRDMLNPIHENLELVFVSNYLRDSAIEDLNISIPDEHSEVIHNPIDTDLFSYDEKPVSQRKKILSIRPYASRTYANDLSVQALLLLSTESWFGELDICLIGDGPLFEETLKPLRKFPNIKIEKRFLTQEEISEYHKQYGLFLCPTRMDSQGVSRDEAMSSGLVPITNAVAAVPEFTDEGCAILAPEESASELAEGIKNLYFDSSQFKLMSRAAAKKVRTKTSKYIVSDQEVELINKI